MTQLYGGCHCGNIKLEITLSDTLESYHPRACDCDFCRSHGAAYISDRNGAVKMTVAREFDLRRHRQGSGIADFLICNNCGVLVAVSYQEEAALYMSINSRAVSAPDKFGDAEATSPKQLSDAERVQRWKELWFSDTAINILQKR